VSAERAWLLVALLAVATAAIKAAGPIAMGGRVLSQRVVGVLGLLPAAMLAALVATGALVRGQHLTIDARTAGLLAAAVALWRGGSVLLGIGVAAVSTALLRLAGWA
jgi:branched-subunit amino acid transport protein